VDSNLVDALISAGIWLGVLVVVRWLLRRGFDRYEERLAERDPSVAARRRTTFGFLLRLVIALIALIGAWSVLSKFPATEQVASAFLASSAVLAVIAGLALTTPLGNLGSGIMLAFAQPVRLGDRVTVDDQTGIVDKISLTYTALTTDAGSRIFVPNTRMISTTIVNRSHDDPRRLVTVELPVRVTAPLDEARSVVMKAAAAAPQGESLAISVQVASVTERTVWLNVVAYAPFGADVSQVASEIREQAVGALGAAELLPA
jgi:small-conductance mechanosensitive channel